MLLLMEGKVSIFGGLVYDIVPTDGLDSKGPLEKAVGFERLDDVGVEAVIPEGIGPLGKDWPEGVFVEKGDELLFFGRIVEG